METVAQKQGRSTNTRLLGVLSLDPPIESSGFGVGAAIFHNFKASRLCPANPRQLASTNWPEALRPREPLNARPYLDPGCPTFLGVYPTNLWDITPKKGGHPGSRYTLPPVNPYT